MVRAAGADPNLVVGLHFAGQRYAQQNPKVVAGFTAATTKSLEYAQE